LRRNVRRITKKNYLPKKGKGNHKGKLPRNKKWERSKGQ
jgi:hypothetical protein